MVLEVAAGGQAEDVVQPRPVAVEKHEGDATTGLAQPTVDADERVQVRAVGQEEEHRLRGAVGVVPTDRAVVDDLDAVACRGESSQQLVDGFGRAGQQARPGRVAGQRELLVAVEQGVDVFADGGVGIVWLGDRFGRQVGCRLAYAGNPIRMPHGALRVDDEHVPLVRAVGPLVDEHGRQAHLPLPHRFVHLEDAIEVARVRYDAEHQGHRALGYDPADEAVVDLLDEAEIVGAGLQDGGQGVGATGQRRADPLFVLLPEGSQVLRGHRTSPFSSGGQGWGRTGGWVGHSTGLSCAV